MDILRFTTAGSVDDGKSTLIGRLFYDTGSIKQDILASVSDNAEQEVNLAYFTDGLRAEREQGITIDVAYKYFSTPRRKYIIADSPGHFEYTKNLVTGASGVDLMIILIDALNGITSQTHKHASVAAFLKLGHVVVAVNKMDAIGYDQDTFTRIKNEFLQLADQLNISNVTFIPVSALLGDNITTSSANMPWYNGIALLDYLEQCSVNTITTKEQVRFSVQHIVHDSANRQCVLGKLQYGLLKKGDEVMLYPSLQKSIVDKMFHGLNEVVVAEGGQNIALYLTDDVPVKRGDILSGLSHPPMFSNEFETEMCWLDSSDALTTGKEYLLRINSFECSCVLTLANAASLAVNEFATVRIVAPQKIAFDTFAALPENGRGIIIDPATNNTSAAFIVLNAC